MPGRVALAVLAILPVLYLWVCFALKPRPSKGERVAHLVCSIVVLIAIGYFLVTSPK